MEITIKSQLFKNCVLQTREEKKHAREKSIEKAQTNHAYRKYEHTHTIASYLPILSAQGQQIFENFFLQREKNQVTKINDL